MLAKGQPDDKADPGHTGKKQTRKVANKEPAVPSTSTGGSTTSGKTKSLELAQSGFTAEVVNILKELHGNQNKVNERLEVLATRVDKIWDYEEPVYDYGEDYYESENSEYPDQVVDLDSEPPTKKQKVSPDSVFKNISEKFNPKESVDLEVNEDLASFVNSTFRDGISDDRQNDLIKDTHRPNNCDALVKTKVNQSIWRLLKPQTQTDDVKMQSIQNNIIKASINITKLLDQAGESLGTSNVELGTNALGLLGQANKLINNKRKECHKNDLDNKYHYLTSHNFPYTDMLYGDDVNKNVREIQDMNRLSRSISRGASNYRGMAPRGRRPMRFLSRGRARGRGFFRGNQDGTQYFSPAPSTVPKNLRMGARK